MEVFGVMSHKAHLSGRCEVEEFEFELNEVYSIDIVMSTGEGRLWCHETACISGRGKETEIRNTVYKRAAGTPRASLKLSKVIR